MIFLFVVQKITEKFYQDMWPVSSPAIVVSQDLGGSVDVSLCSQQTSTLVRVSVNVQAYLHQELEFLDP